MDYRQPSLHHRVSETPSVSAVRYYRDPATENSVQWITDETPQICAGKDENSRAHMQVIEEGSKAYKTNVISTAKPLYHSYLRLTFYLNIVVG